MSCDLVIFDCDGVLVDSEPIANKIFTRTLRDLGFDWSYDEVCERFIGKSMAHCVEAIENGVSRGHLLYGEPGVLLQELYTTDGTGA